MSPFFGRKRVGHVEDVGIEPGQKWGSPMILKTVGEPATNQGRSNKRSSRTRKHMGIKAEKHSLPQEDGWLSQPWTWVQQTGKDMSLDQQSLWFSQDICGFGKKTRWVEVTTVGGFRTSMRLSTTWMFPDSAIWLSSLPRNGPYPKISL